MATTETTWNPIMKSLVAIFLSLLIPSAYCRTNPTDDIVTDWALLVSQAGGQANQPKSEAPATDPFKTITDGYLAPLLTGPMALRGLVVGLVHDGRSEVRGYGKAGQSGGLPDGESLFQIASVTKPFTALLLAQLVAEGKVAYDDVAITFKDKPVTYRQLVTHTSGLPLLASNLPHGSMEEFRRFLGEYSLTREPGCRFEYSVLGYSVLGLCLSEKCGSGTFEASLTSRVLGPLGMSSTSFELSKADESRFAGDLLPKPRQNGPNIGNPSGGLISSADDLLRFISANLQPQSQPNLAKAIELTHQIPTPEIQTFPGSVAALGWEVMAIGPAKYYWHSGVGPGRVFITFDLSSHTGVVILTNTAMQPFDTRMEMAGFSLLGALANMK
jgi:serine-type D-Ala-D-Ala carboxypeptidase/endopeptidase